MKVLVCARGYNSFKENSLGCFELDQAKALKAVGCDVRIASLDLRSPRRARPLGAKMFAQKGMHCVTVNSMSSALPSKAADTLAKKAAAQAVKWICRDGWKPDVIHAHFTEIASAFRDEADKLGAKYVVTEHSSAMNKASPDEKTLAQAKRAYSKADMVIAVGSALSAAIKQSTGVNAETVGNIVDTQVFDLNRQKHDGAFRFVSCGNLVEIKRFDVLLDAFAKLSDTSAVLTIFGDGPLKSELLAQCARLGIAERVTFAGHKPRDVIAEEYAKSDAFVLASRSETFGVSLLEAMCSGLPVAATKCGGPQDFVWELNGRLAEVGNAKSLAQAMEDIQMRIDDFDSERIRRFVMSRYSPQAVAERLEEIYERLLNS
ncbi:MAG: glycosyltransferase [Ruminococcus sp.]|nr:glycosyltransferase [Ruminococcus sp.]